MRQKKIIIKCRATTSENANTSKTSFQTNSSNQEGVALAHMVMLVLRRAWRERDTSRVFKIRS